jgi:hypothetical protein
MNPDYAPVFADHLAEEQFSRDGYLVMPLLKPAEVEVLTRLYLDIVPDQPADFYTTAFLPDSDERRAMTDGLTAVLAPYFAELMPGYEIHSRGYVVKRGGPGQPPLRLHQDYTFVDQNIHRSVHIWIPLLDVGEKNGCLTVIPRTHRLVNHISAQINNPSPYDPVRPVLEAECKIPVPMKAGDVFFFDERLYHGSTANSDPGLRIAVAGALLPKGVKQLLYVVDEEDPGKLNILEFRDEFAVRFGQGKKMLPPYPDGVTRIGTLAYQPEVLSAEKLDSLRIRRAEPEKMPEVDAAAMAKPGLFSRLFGRQ